MRYLFVSLFIHLLLFSFIWVGLSAPGAQEHDAFIYLGEVVAGEGSKNLPSQQPASDVLMYDESSQAFFGPWLKMRELNKPK